LKGSAASAALKVIVCWPFLKREKKKEEEAQQHRFRISPCSAPDDAGSTGR